MFTFIFLRIIVLPFPKVNKVVNAFVWSVALYGSETWTLQKEDIRRREAFEIRIHIRISGV